MKLMNNVTAMNKRENWLEILNRLSLSEYLQDKRNIVDKLLTLQFPTRKTEAWKYSDLKWLQKTDFSRDFVIDEAFVHRALEEILTVDLLNLPRIITYNGQYLETFSTISLHSNEFSLNKNLKSGWSIPNDDFLTALNKVVENPVLQFNCNKNFNDQTILCINLGKAETTEKLFFSPKYSFYIEKENKCSVIEINYGKGVYFANSVHEIELGRKSKLNYTIINHTLSESYNCSSNYVKLSDHACYQQFLLNKGSRFSRYELNIDLAGEWSKADFDAVQILSGQQHADIASKVVHSVPHCQSNQNVKNILSDNSHGVYQGKVLVNHLAQKTDAQQQNQALLLSDKAEIDTKPELEIYADDVKCSHGAAIGALDQEQLFFLMSRGISYELAREMLINAFVNESIEKIEDTLLQNLLYYYVTAST